MFQVRIENGNWKDNVDLHAETCDEIFNEVSDSQMPCTNPKAIFKSLPSLANIIEEWYGSSDVFDFDHDIEIKSFSNEVLKLSYSTNIRYKNSERDCNRSGIITIMEQV